MGGDPLRTAAIRDYGRHGDIWGVIGVGECFGDLPLVGKSVLRSIAVEAKRLLCHGLQKLVGFPTPDGKVEGADWVSLPL
jgi:hypothetical protein